MAEVKDKLVTVESMKYLQDKMKGETDSLKSDLSELFEEVGQLKQNGTGTGTGLSAEIKSALMAVVENIGLWKDGNGQTYIDNLRTALYNEPLSSISAVYTQSKTVYVSDNLDVLKDDLVVTGTYTDGSSAIVTDYTLSGTLTVGTSMITVSKNGKTATFEVTVTASRVPATGITLNNTTLSFTGSTPIQLTATVEPSNSTDTVVWSSSEDAVATVDENGLVTPIANGTCTITATCGNHSVDCSVSITLPLSGYNFGNPCLNYVNSNPTTLGKTDEELKGKFYNGAYNSWGNAIGITNQYWFLYPLGEGTYYIRTVSRSSLPGISFYAFSNSDIVANPTTTLGKVGTDYTEATVTVFTSFDCEYTNSQGIVNLGEYSYVDESGQTYSDSLVQLRKVVVPKDVYVFMAIFTISANNWPGISEAHPYMNDLYTIFEEDPSSNILQIVE